MAFAKITMEALSRITLKVKEQVLMPLGTVEGRTRAAPAREAPQFIQLLK